jgi:hypothetical protein
LLTTQGNQPGTGPNLKDAFAFDEIGVILKQFPQTLRVQWFPKYALVQPNLVGKLVNLSPYELA